MKRLSYLLMLALAYLLAAAPSYAQTASKVTFRVSFPFIAGAAAMPAGTYTIYEDETGRALIYPAEGGRSAVILLTRIDSFAPGNRGASVSFIARRGQYYLDTVSAADGAKVRVNQIAR